VNGRRLSLVRILLIPTLIAALTGAAACGGSDDGGNGPTPPPANVPFSQTDLVTGSGTVATTGRFLTVHYTGWLYSASGTDNKGTQFDSSVGTNPYGFTLGLGSVIRGWDLGLVGMRVGGQRRLVIPPDLAYGAAGRGSIPPNATLVFDVELVNVQ
jgi:FKBP-type peptidyl-prolyl cis-trans isomerase FkpA